MVWTLFFRWALARKSGRMSSMAAPVVPVQLARAVPRSSIPVLTAGRPTRVPVRQMPPEMVKSARSKIMNGTYSKSTVCTTWYMPRDTPWIRQKGMT